MGRGKPNDYVHNVYKEKVFRGAQVGSWTIESDSLPKNNMIAVRCKCGTRSHVKSYNLFNGQSLKCANCTKDSMKTFRMTAVKHADKNDFPDSTKEEDKKMISDFLKNRK